MKDQIFKVGISGLGTMGRQHARWITTSEAPGLKLHAVCDTSPSRLSDWDDDPEVSQHGKFSTLLESGIDAVIIATPHYAHTTQGIAALKKGLHVLVEKPISVHKADAQKLIAAHTRKEQVFGAVFNQRTNPVYQKLRQLIQDGELGPLQRINWIITDWYRTEFYYKSGGWRATWAGEGGGVLINQCPHQLDLYQWLFGQPTKVRGFCQIGRFHDIEVEDAVTAFFEHENGAQGVFTTTTGEAPGTNRLEVAGERGKVVIENNQFHFTRNEMPTSEHLLSAQQSFSRPEIWEVSIPVQGPGEQHRGVLRNFAAACQGREPLLAPAAEGINSVELANATLYSSATESTLSLPLDADAYASWLAEKIAGSRYKPEPAEDATPPADLSGSF